MPPLYYLDESREPRVCPCVTRPNYDFTYTTPNTRAFHRCHDCKGTRRLGKPGAEPDVEIVEQTSSGPMLVADPGFYWRRLKRLQSDDPADWLAGEIAPGAWYGPHLTEPEALAAAREAAKER